jgi:rhodanese-related sulfurtransferase
MSLLGLLSKLKGTSSPHVIEHAMLDDACRNNACHVIDVREPHEYAGGHLPGANLPNDKPVVLVCQAGARSARALDAAHGAGRTDVVHYAAGTSGWMSRGGSVQT